jgi:hypothetical protein
VLIEEMLQEIIQRNSQNMPARAKADDIKQLAEITLALYRIMTSGSTGVASQSPETRPGLVVRRPRRQDPVLLERDEQFIAALKHYGGKATKGEVETYLIEHMLHTGDLSATAFRLRTKGKLKRFSTPGIYEIV